MSENKNWHLLDRTLVKEILAYIPFRINVQHILQGTPLIFKESLFSFVITNVTPEDLLLLLDHCYTCTGYYHVMLIAERPKPDLFLGYKRNTLKIAYVNSQTKSQFLQKNLFQYGTWTIHTLSFALDMFLSHQQFTCSSSIRLNMLKEKTTIISDIPLYNDLVTIDDSKLKLLSLYKIKCYNYGGSVNRDSIEYALPRLLPRTMHYRIAIDAENDYQKEWNMKALKTLVHATHVKSIGIRTTTKSTHYLPLIWSYFDEYSFGSLREIILNCYVMNNNTAITLPSNMTVYTKQQVKKYGIQGLLMMLLNKYPNIQCLRLKNLDRPLADNIHVFLNHVHTLRLKTVAVTHEQRIMLIKLMTREYREESIDIDTIPFSDELEEALKNTKARVYLDNKVQLHGKHLQPLLCIPSLRRVQVQWPVKIPCLANNATDLHSCITRTREFLSNFETLVSQVHAYASKGIRIEKLKIGCGYYKIDTMNCNSSEYSKLLAELIENTRTAVEFLFDIKVEWAA
jgi:hypothetical protein